MRPKRSLGQNFLQDESVLARIAAALEPKGSDTVIEIGPGRGALTEHLVASGARIIALELDRELVPVLRTRFHFSPNFSVVEGDVLTTDIAALIGPADPKDVKIVGNLPYNISTPIIQRLIEIGRSFSRAVLMLQREVVERLTAPAGNSDRGFISVLVEDAFDSAHLFDVGPEAFFPRPKVWSSVMRLTPQPSHKVDPELRRMVSIGFSQKRKTIFNNLKTAFPADDAAAMLSSAGVDPGRRAETLSLDEWKELFNSSCSDGERGA